MWFKRKREPDNALPGVGKYQPSPWRRYWQKMSAKILPALSITLLISVVTVPIIIFAWFFFATDIFQVQAVTVVDAQPDTSKQAKEIINQRLSQSPLAKNIFFLPADSLEDEITSKVPQIRTIHILRKIPGTIKAIVQEKQPALLLQSNGNYYFVDQEGIAYQEASIANLPGVLLPIVKNDDRLGSVTLGVAAVAPPFVSFVQMLEKELPAAVGAKPAEMHIPSLAAKEVHVKLENNWLILFDTTRPEAGQINVLKKLLSSVVSSEEISQLQYIDIRIPNRVYYKSTSNNTKRH